MPTCIVNYVTMLYHISYSSKRRELGGWSALNHTKMMENMDVELHVCKKNKEKISNYFKGVWFMTRIEIGIRFEMDWHGHRNGYIPNMFGS